MNKHKEKYKPTKIKKMAQFCVKWCFQFFIIIFTALMNGVCQFEDVTEYFVQFFIFKRTL